MIESLGKNLLDATKLWEKDENKTFVLEDLLWKKKIAIPLPLSPAVLVAAIELGWLVEQSSLLSLTLLCLGEMLSLVESERLPNSDEKPPKPNG
jgi:hypothetical protein